MMLCLNISNIAITTAIGVAYRWIVHSISKSESMH